MLFCNEYSFAKKKKMLFQEVWRGTLRRGWEGEHPGAECGLLQREETLPGLGDGNRCRRWSGMRVDKKYLRDSLGARGQSVVTRVEEESRMTSEEGEEAGEEQRGLVMTCRGMGLRKF